MYKLFVCAVIFSSFVLFSSASVAQEEGDFHVVHVQTFKMDETLGDDAEAFNEMLKRQSGVINGDERVLRSYVLRHFWGADSRDLVLVTEFESSENLFAFYDELNAMFEKAFSQEQRDKDDELWGKYVGQHSDEIYRVLTDTRK